MIEFKAYLGQGDGLHFACTNTSGDLVAEELLRLDQLAREITGVALAGYGEALRGSAEVNPMVILALIATGHMSSRVSADKAEIYTRDPRDPTNPAAKIFAGVRFREVTVVVCFSGPGEDRR